MADPPEMTVDLSDCEMQVCDSEEDGLRPTFNPLAQRSVSTTTVVPAMHLSWHNINAYAEDETAGYSNPSFFDDESPVKKTQHKDILRNVFGAARPGEVLAMMGSSGAGKTTLLNVLTRRNMGVVKVDGAVKINGLRVDREYMSKVSAYVQQDDLFIGALTVREHLMFNARLRMGRRYSEKDMLRRVKMTMNELGLSKCADTPIRCSGSKSLSGGEKKRLAFACEILTSPPILLCDEPTSGLDSFLAFQVVQVLRNLAHRKGMCIVLTIHQPSSQVFELFDRVYMMAEGRVAFCGTQQEAVNMWQRINLPVPRNFNPADHFIATLAVQHDKHTERRRTEINRICDEYQHSDIGKELETEARTSDQIGTEENTSSSGQWRAEQIHEKYGAKYRASWWQQLRALVWRNGKAAIRDPTVIKAQLAQTVLIAVMTGLIYLATPVEQATIRNINGSLFENICNMNFLFQFVIVRTIVVEFPVFIREHHGRLYRTSTYFLAKNIIEIPQYWLQASIFCTILYWMSGLYPSADAFGAYLLVSLATQAAALSISYLCACVFSQLSTALAVLPLFVVPLLAFGGFFINSDTLPVYFVPLKYLSYFNYGYESLAINEWSRVDDIPGCNPRNRTLAPCLPTGSDVLASLSFNTSHMWRNVAALVGMSLLFRLAAYAALRYRASKY